MEPNEGQKMGEMSLKNQEAQLADQLRKDLRNEFPQIDEKQLEIILGIRLKTLLAPPIKVSEVIKPVDMGEDRDLSLNYKKRILAK